mgnify:CR=1 FL=1
MTEVEARKLLREHLTRARLGYYLTHLTLMQKMASLLVNIFEQGREEGSQETLESDRHSEILREMRAERG